MHYFSILPLALHSELKITEKEILYECKKKSSSNSILYHFIYLTKVAGVCDCFWWIFVQGIIFNGEVTFFETVLKWTARGCFIFVIPKPWGKIDLWGIRYIFKFLWISPLFLFRPICPNPTWSLHFKISRNSLIIRGGGINFGSGKSTFYINEW